ncbi:MAG TPA: glycosyltransferase family 2 protein [Acidobacteriota bacterium]|jgi:GT2 family glycosyltransferase
MWSFVIPTFNRAEILRRCLNALEVQTSSSEFEVIVVDDGSTDQTSDLLNSWHSNRFELRHFRQENKKPAAARNLGVSYSRGHRILFLGDDIIASPEFLEQHVEAHRRHPDITAVLGYTVWSSELRITRFMKYLGEEGWQFGYSLIEDPENVPFNFFYTSNISLQRSLFDAIGPFDESFGTAGWEDTEYGYRLKQGGGKIVFQRTALAEHLHPTSFESFCERQFRVGQYAPYFYRKHPELREFLGADIVFPSASRRLLLNLLTKVCSLEERFPSLDFSRYYPDLMTYHYMRGLIAASGQFTQT